MSRIKKVDMSDALFDSSSSDGEEQPGHAFDEEKDWLKAGGAEDDSGGEGDSGAGEDDEDDNDDDQADMLPIERDEARMRKKQKKTAAEEQQELVLNLGDRERFSLPSADEVAREEREGLELQTAQQRIQDVLRVLGNFGQEREKEMSREQYVKQLKRDLAFYYGYNKFLISQILRLFSPPEAVEFLESNETPRPVTIRCNTLKARRRDLAQSLIARGVNLDPIEWSKAGLQVFESTVPIGATPEYLSGQYMLQGAASFLPVMALGAQPGERVLDMCAAPGGKTTHIAQDMKNTGCLFANDVNRDRISALTSNVHRMGITNCIISNLCATSFPGAIGGFDRVLLDAPCSGLGVIVRDARIKVSKTISDIHTCRNLQKKLILHAIDSVNAASSAAVIIYCTCTISVEENELIVQHALDSRDVELVDSELPFGKPGFVRYDEYRFSPKMALCRRFYPHVHNTDGFFVAKLVKKSNAIKRVVAEAEEEEKKAVAERLIKKKKKEKAKKMRKVARLAAQGIQKGGGRKHKKRASDGQPAESHNDDE